ncbi:MAG TPA: hypothetical protein PLJ60_02635 [Chryseolinea sp.]|nr:hypothetical protein [Chryseolinea sp.]HPM29208.1 hypothetical protein [Chryseolinea sp.]
MKKSIWLFLSAITVFVSCKDEAVDSPNAISSEEAAIMAGSSFASNSSGVSLVSKESANKSEDILEDNANGRVATCGVSQTIDLSANSPIGGIITWSYDFNYKFRLNCKDEAPDNITVSLSYNGAFDGPKLMFEHSGLSEIALTALDASSENFMLDGTYKRSGSFEIKEGEVKSGSSSITITLNDVAVDKSTHKIVSGSSTFLLTGSVSGKGTFKYDGTVEFNDGDTAILKIKSDIFLLNLNDGSVTPQ